MRVPDVTLNKENYFTRDLASKKPIISLVEAMQHESTTDP